MDETKSVEIEDESGKKWTAMSGGEGEQVKLTLHMDGWTFVLQTAWRVVAKLF